MRKANRTPKASRRRKRAVHRRVSSALASYLRKMNPAFRSATHVRVKHLKNGAVTIIPLRKNVAQGFYDGTGFHPIRSSRDYDPERAGDEY